MIISWLKMRGGSLRSILTADGNLNSDSEWLILTFWKSPEWAYRREYPSVRILAGNRIHLWWFKWRDWVKELFAEVWAGLRGHWKGRGVTKRLRAGQTVTTPRAKEEKGQNCSYLSQVRPGAIEEEPLAAAGDPEEASATREVTQKREGARKVLHPPCPIICWGEGRADRKEDGCGRTNEGPETQEGCCSSLQIIASALSLNTYTYTPHLLLSFYSFIIIFKPHDTQKPLQGREMECECYGVWTLGASRYSLGAPWDGSRECAWGPGLDPYCWLGVDLQSGRGAQSEWGNFSPQKTMAFWG